MQKIPCIPFMTKLMTESRSSTCRIPLSAVPGVYHYQVTGHGDMVTILEPLARRKVMVQHLNYGYGTALKLRLWYSTLRLWYSTYIKVMVQHLH